MNREQRDARREQNRQRLEPLLIARTTLARLVFSEDFDGDLGEVGKAALATLPEAEVAGWLNSSVKLAAQRRSVRPSLVVCRAHSCGEG